MEAKDAPDLHDWVRCMRGSDLKSRDRSVAQALMSYANSDGTKAHPGIERLVEDLGSSKSTVIRGLNSLTEKGWIRCVHQGRKHRGASEYRLTIPVDREHLARRRIRWDGKVAPKITVVPSSPQGVEGWVPDRRVMR